MFHRCFTGANQLKLCAVQTSTSKEIDRKHGQKGWGGYDLIYVVNWLWLQNNMMQTSDDCLKLIYVSVSVPIQINLKYNSKILFECVSFRVKQLHDHQLDKHSFGDPFCIVSDPDLNYLQIIEESLTYTPTPTSTNPPTDVYGH